MEKSIIAVNPQASLCELSWLGGIIDGEGCLTFDKRNGGGFRKQQCVAPTITVVNTEESIMSKVQDILLSHDIAFYYRIHPQVKNWRRKIEVIVAGLKRVLRLLDLIQPYLVGKAKKAVLLRSFCESRIRNVGEYSELEKDICRQIWTLNGRGTKHW